MPLLVKISARYFNETIFQHSNAVERVECFDEKHIPDLQIVFLYAVQGPPASHCFVESDSQSRRRILAGHYAPLEIEIRALNH